MKLTTILAALLMSATFAFSQGSIVFNNRVTGSIVTHIYGPDPANPFARLSGNGPTDFPVGTRTYGGVGLAGTGYTVQIWGGPAGATADQLTLATNGTASFRTGAAAGFIAAPVGANPTIAQGAGANVSAPAAIQLRAWDNVGGTITSWAAAMANPSIAQGFSPLFTSEPLGAGTISSPNLIGLQSFNIAPVPEPGIIALGVLGLGALLLRRRK